MNFSRQSLPLRPCGKLPCRGCSCSVGKFPHWSTEHKRNRMQYASPSFYKDGVNVLVLQPVHNIHSYHIFIYGISLYIFTSILVQYQWLLFYSFYWNTHIAHATLSPPSNPQNLWLRLFAFISPNHGGHILSYPIVVILLIYGRAYVPSPNNTGGKKYPSRLSLVTSQSCVLFSAIISVWLSFCL